jgi:hypothetical protein
VILYPAIDVRGGRAVRLTHGDFDAETVYHDDPLEAARSWVDAGARFLHVVDLDGAKSARRPRSSTSAGSSPAPACRCSTAAACGPSTRCARRCAPVPSA